MNRPAVPSLDAIRAALLASYETGGGINHLDGVNLPSQESVGTLARDFMHLLFPGYFEEAGLARDAVPAHVAALLARVDARLRAEVEKSLRFARHPDPAAEAAAVVAELLGEFVAVRRIVQTDVAAALAGDPAARSVEEIILAYPCVLAISLQRIAHRLHRRGVPLLPRMITELAHERTGCDIHPGAQLGGHFFIDHGTGVVIGETAIVGEHVKIYQGVTLGAKSFATDSTGAPVRGRKRHPAIGDHVTIYAGATILGGDTHIGEHSIIGAGVWVMESVPANSVVTYVSSGLTIRPRRSRDAGAGADEWMI